MRRCANGDGAHTSPDPRRCCRAIVTSAALPTLLAKKAPSVDDGVLFERRPRRADAIVRSRGDVSAFSTARGEMDAMRAGDPSYLATLRGRIPAKCI